MEKKTKQSIETKLASLCWEDEENGIVSITMNTIEVINVKDAEEIVEALKDNFYPYNNNLKAFIDISEQNRLSKENIKYGANQDGIYKYINAMALYSNNQYEPTTMLIYGLLKVMKMPKPTLLFFNKQKALEWLRTLD